LLSRLPSNLARHDPLKQRHPQRAASCRESKDVGMSEISTLVIIFIAIAIGVLSAYQARKRRQK
jgi:hypothetical protein